MQDVTPNTTPIDVSDFEREQLRFFLTNTDIVRVLGELNPSLAWLPILAGMKLLQHEAALATWVERNFSSLDAVRDVVNNILFFRAESARILEFRLNALQDALEPLLVKCWRLIIRHIQNAEHGALQNEWFQLAPNLKRGDLSTEVLRRLTDVLTPKLFVEKRYGWYDIPGHKIERPSDVISIKYKVDDGVGERDFFGVWPSMVPVELEEQFIRTLTTSLCLVLADAIDVGAESNVGLSISDVDVPSVAAHEQNSFREGFLPIVRVIAELWLRLIKRDARAACDIVQGWQNSNFRLVHRLALYAAADTRISPDLAADVLIHLPAGELFLTNSQVEVHRLMRGRWAEFPEEKRAAIERRIIDGPPTNWFKVGVDLSRPMDRCRFELLLDLERGKVPMGKQAAELLSEIRRRHPTWSSAEPEKVGFTMWHGSVAPAVGNKEKLALVPSDQLILAAKKAKHESHFMEGDSWQGLCQSEPIIAFRGIKDAPTSERWHQWAWRPLLWAANNITDIDELNQLATLLVQWPDTAAFEETASGAAFWMDQVSNKLNAPVLWRLWDFIERRSPRRDEILNDDVFSTAINDPSGNLASVLLKRTPRPRGKVELGRQLRLRYQKLIAGDDTFALLARVRLSAAVSFLFERAPIWTTENILPSFDWDSSDALAMWSARKYSNHIGSQKLFELTKKPFIELFSRPDVSEEDRNVFSDWLAAILLANRAGKANYPLTTSEARSILRRAGQTTLSAFAHRLAIEMESANSEQKQDVWNEIVGPVFEGSWPLDAELQTPNATFKLAQILLATGSAFTTAAITIMPFIRAESARDYTTIYSISHAKDDYFKAAPQTMLDILSSVAGDAPDRTLFGLSTALEKIREVAPQLAQTKQFQKLAAQASAH
jgi:hypothetical protein